MWEVESIDNESSLFIRVAYSNISPKDHLPRAAAFLNTPKHGDNLSSDWSKYCTAKISWDSIGRQRKTSDGSFKDPGIFCIWEMNVGKIRTEVLPKQLVEHDPVYNDPEDHYVPNNRAHSIIVGDKQNNAEVRVCFLKVGQWAIGPATK